MLTILLSFLASPVFAGNELECEPLKDGASKGLYGLCIAYHNAGNSNARQKIWDNYDKKAVPGDPKMPGTGTERKTATCPCLEDPNVVSIENWGVRVGECTIDSNGTDQGLFVNLDTFFTTDFTTSSDGVIHMCDITQSLGAGVMLSIDAAEYEECLTQLLMLCI
jgi:hypothetical protein